MGHSGIAVLAEARHYNPTPLLMLMLLLHSYWVGRRRRRSFRVVEVSRSWHLGSRLKSRPFFRRASSVLQYRVSFDVIVLEEDVKCPESFSVCVYMYVYDTLIRLKPHSLLFKLRSLYLFILCVVNRWARVINYRNDCSQDSLVGFLYSSCYIHIPRAVSVCMKSIFRPTKSVIVTNNPNQAAS